MAVSKLGIYNDALIKVGEDVLDNITEDRDSRYALDAVYDAGAVKLCLEKVQPRFAVKTAALTQAASSTAYTYSYALPSDFITVVGVFADADLDQEITRYVQDGSALLTDSATVYLRYVWNESTEANFTEAFAHVLALYLAFQTSYKFDPDRYASLAEQYTAAATELAEAEINRDPLLRPVASGSPLSDALRTIYNDALQILGRDKLPLGVADTPDRVRLDTALDSGAIEDVLEDTEWKFGVTSTRIEYDPDVVPEWGYERAHQKPADVLRIVGLFQDEMMHTPLKYYSDEGDYFFCGNDTVYLQYISDTWLTQTSAWPRYFARLVAARLAFNAAPVINPAMLLNAESVYVRRKSSAMSNDAVQSPPRVIRSGDWTRSRYSGGRDRDRP